MNHPTLADNKTCTGCLTCVDTCPKGALTAIYNEEGHLTYRCDTDKCVLCHLCEHACPVVSSFPYKQENSSSFYAAWCLNKQARAKSSSGGAFVAMAQYIINQGGYVVGASNEGVCDIKHIVINDLKDLPKLQGSKYIQSDAHNIYKQTYNLLKDGKLVLFSGTGCQVAGLLSYLKRKKYSGHLVTVDLICGGVPSKLLADKFIENEPFKVSKILSFRTKENGWKSKGFAYNMKCIDADGKIHDYTKKRNLLTDGFCSEMTERYSCYDCKFNGSSRACDFTIGDLWGDTKHKEQHQDGVSLIIAHNNKAINLLTQMKEYLHFEPTDSKHAIANNHRIVDGKNVIGKLWERKHLVYLFSHLSYPTLKHIYANDIKHSSPWMLYKIYRKVRIELMKRLS